MNQEIERVHASGVDFKEYLSGMRVHVEKSRDIYDALGFIPRVPAVRGSLGSSRILVLTEEFCIDSVLNLPLIARLVEASKGAEMRIALRNDNEELACRFAGRGGQSRVPTAIFHDNRGVVRGCWSERSRADHEWMAAFSSTDPIPEILLEEGRPAPTLAAWMERRYRAQRPFLISHGWRFVHDELRAIASGTEALRGRSALHETRRATRFTDA